MAEPVNINEDGKAPYGMGVFHYNLLTYSQIRHRLPKHFGSGLSYRYSHHEKFFGSIACNDYSLALIGVADLLLRLSIKSLGKLLGITNCRTILLPCLDCKNEILENFIHCKQCTRHIRYLRATLFIIIGEKLPSLTSVDV